MNYIGWFIWALALTGSVEYFWHKYVLHHNAHKYLKHYCISHVVGHHRDGLNDRTNHINIHMRDGMIAVAPIILIQMCFGLYIEAIIVGLSVVIYCKIWSEVHANIHEVGGKWTGSFPIFKRIKAHHLRHHEEVGKNFSALFSPTMDVICRTSAGKGI